MCNNIGMAGLAEYQKKAGAIAFQQRSCRGCGGEDISIFYTVSQVPVHSVLLMRSERQARDYQKGDIVLGFCHRCGFISNFAYDAGLEHYCSNCEEGQDFSDTFNRFEKSLARRLIEENVLRGKDIVEIGCGKGGFLLQLCELGANRGVGFDPAYVRGRDTRETKADIRFVEDFFSEKYVDVKADFICCKMTLEHIFETGDFLKTVRASIDGDRKVKVFFQVPDIRRIFNEGAFWDVYYEHCCYFSEGSLRRLFELSGFVVEKLWRDYGGQYLMVEAGVEGTGLGGLAADIERVEQIERAIERFVLKCSERIKFWHRYLSEAKKNRLKVVLWGSGSKAVSFLTTLGIFEEVEYVVDINTYRQGTFMAGTAQRIVGPEFLKSYQPDVVVVMNPIYEKEIGEKLAAMGLDVDLKTVLCEESDR